MEALYRFYSIFVMGHIEVLLRVVLKPCSLSPVVRGSRGFGRGFREPLKRVHGSERSQTWRHPDHVRWELGFWISRFRV